MEDVQSEKGSYARFVDTFALYWTPVVLVSAVLLVTMGGAITGRSRSRFKSTFKGLYLYTGDVLFHAEWCIRQL